MMCFCGVHGQREGERAGVCVRVWGVWMCVCGAGLYWVGRVCVYVCEGHVYTCECVFLWAQEAGCPVCRRGTA